MKLPPRIDRWISLFNTTRMMRNAAQEAQRSKLPQMAAALSFRTIFGLIPVMVVALVALKAFTTQQDLKNALASAMQYSGLTSIAVDDQPAVGPPAPPTVEGASFEEKVEAHEAKKQRLDDWISELVQRVFSVNVGAITIVGIGALFYAALSMIVEVERAFNQVFRVPTGRSWVRRITHYWTLLTLMPLGLFATFAVGQRVTAWIADPNHLGGLGRGQVIVVGAAGFISTVGISTLLFLLAYTVVPNTRVKLMPAFIGALLAAILWEAGKWGFTQYVRYSAGYSRLYGSIALIPLFLMWVYVTWCIALIGLNVSYYLQYGKAHREAQPEDTVPPTFVDPAAILSVMAVMARRFTDGQPVDAPALSKQLTIYEPIITQMLDRLTASGHVLKVQFEDKEGYYSLARPPERIDAEEVLKLGDELAGRAASGGDDLGRIGQNLRESRLATVRSRTIASLIEAPDLSKGNGTLAAPTPPKLRA